MPEQLFLSYEGERWYDAVKTDIKRPTEDAALRNIERDLRIKAKVVDLTPLQREVWALHIEAKRIGVNSARYIARALEKSVRTAQRYLASINTHFDAFEQLVALYSDESYQIPLATRRKIINSRDNMIVACAAAGTDGCRGNCSARYGICSSCRKQYGYPDRMNPLTKKWLPSAIRMVRNQAYSDAKYAIQGRLIAAVTPTYNRQMKLAI